MKTLIEPRPVTIEDAWDQLEAIRLEYGPMLMERLQKKATTIVENTEDVVKGLTVILLLTVPYFI